MISVRKDLFPSRPPAAPFSIPATPTSIPPPREIRDVDVIDGFTFLSYSSLEDLNGDDFDRVFNKSGSLGTISASFEKMTATDVRKFFAAETLQSIERQLVMGRLKGHPFWPGVVLTMKSESGDKSRGEETVVRYLGEPTFSSIEETETRSFPAAFPKHLGRINRKRKMQFLFGFSEARVLIALKRPASGWTSGNSRHGVRRRRELCGGKANGRNLRRCIDLHDVFLRGDVDDDEIAENLEAFERTMAEDCGKCGNCQKLRSRRKRFPCSMKREAVKEEEVEVICPPIPKETTVETLASKTAKVFEVRRLSDRYKSHGPRERFCLVRSGSMKISSLPLKKRYTASLLASEPGVDVSRPADSTAQFISQLQKQVHLPRQDGGPDAVPLLSPERRTTVQPSILQFFPSRRNKPVVSDWEEKQRTIEQFLRLTKKQKEKAKSNTPEEPEVEVPLHLAEPSLILKAVNLVPKTDHNGNHVRAAHAGRVLRSRSTLKFLKNNDRCAAPKVERGRFSSAELAALYESYDKDPNPKEDEIERIAKSLYLKDIRRVKVWFANQRARARQESKFLKGLRKPKIANEARTKNSRYSFRNFSHIKGYVIVTGDENNSSDESSSGDVETADVKPIKIIAEDHDYCAFPWGQN